jgi:hypothetical protein
MLLVYGNKFRTKAKAYDCDVYFFLGHGYKFRFKILEGRMDAYLRSGVSDFEFK